MRQRLTRAWGAFLEAAERERESARNWPAAAYPHYSEAGRWRLLNASQLSSWDGSTYEHGNWTAGFWHGVQWLRAAGAGDSTAAELAAGKLADLGSRADDTTTHDLGFLFFPSYVLGHRLGYVGDDEVGPAHRAGSLLARRLNARGGYLQAFGAIGDHRSAGTSTIDTMLNLPLLWWASSEGGDPALFEAARTHARTSARLYFRPDGSTYHLLRFDPLSGALLDRGTFQGAGADSCWSRGQAWAACGFAWSYAATGEPELLAAADRAASYFFDRLPANSVAPWDFGDPSADAPKDASASMIAALGCLVLKEIHPDQERRGWYADTADTVLADVAEASLNTAPDRDGVLVDSCYSRPHGLGLDGATGWGDFFAGLALAVASGTIPLSTALAIDVTLG